MKSNYLKITTTLLVGLILTFSVYQLCYFVAEKYFFDKFFYYKSISHGYLIPGKEEGNRIQYGDRAKDLNALNTKNVLGVTTSDKYYKIAITGDSLVWGQGIRNSQRFATLVEKKLNEIRPTKVYSLGNNGDNIFDNYQKYKESIDVFGQMNTYIFGLYNNDLVFNSDDRYQTKSLLITKLSENCTGESVYDPEFDPKITDLAFYYAKLNSLKEGSLNLCAFNKLAPLFPKENALYIDLGNIENDHEVKREFSNIVTKNFSILKPHSNNNINTQVSIKEGHPSAYSNQLYANDIVKEIITNPKYKFNEQP